MKVKTVAACQAHRHGGPWLFYAIIKCSKEEYENGDHVSATRRLARDHGAESYVVVLDENDECRGNLFDDFDSQEVETGKVIAEDRRT